MSGSQQAELACYPLRELMVDNVIQWLTTSYNKRTKYDMRISIRLEKDLARMLEARVKEERFMNKSDVVKMALFTYLSNNHQITINKDADKLIGRMKNGTFKTRPKTLTKRVDEHLTFDEFWAVYPKKRGKGAALSSWTKIRPSKDLTQEIIKSVESHVQSPDWLKDGGQFIPNPATFLNQRRWQDEPDTANNQAFREGAHKAQKDRSKVDLAIEMVRSENGKDNNPFG